MVSTATNRTRTAAALLAITAASAVAFAGNIYSGYDVTFTKPAFADYTQPENQDRITGNVWITRAASQGIFNIAQEPSFQGGGATSPSPVGTEWAFGTTAVHPTTLSFGTWGDVHGGSPASLVGQNLVLHLVDDDIYLDIRFTDWGVTPASGGTFTYVRSLIPSGCNAADIAEPFGVLDLADISGFVSAFLSNGDAADIAEPFGVFDLADLSAFVTAFLGGCP